jgi:hypothetical protein
LDVNGIRLKLCTRSYRPPAGIQLASASIGRQSFRQGTKRRKMISWFVCRGTLNRMP